MKKVFIAGWGLIVATAFAWAVVNWNIGPHSKVNFKVAGPLNIDVNGTFDIAEAQIKFDPDLPSGATFIVSIPVTSINTNNSLRDHHLKGAEYFDADKFQHITFKSISVEKTADGKYSVTGMLTIKQVTKTVVIPFTFSQTDNEGVFTGSLKINRLDFGVGPKTKLIANEVRIDLNIKVNK